MGLAHRGMQRWQSVRSRLSAQKNLVEDLRWAGYRERTGSVSLTLCETSWSFPVARIGHSPKMCVAR